MKSLKSKIIKIAVGLFLFIVSFFIFLTIINLIPSKSSHEINSKFDTKYIKISEFKNYTGYIDLDTNYLNRIDILFKNPNLESRDELIITISDLNKIVYEQKFTGFNFGDTSRARLDFSSIPNSKGKKYIINIIPNKIVDGKLAVGIKNDNLDIIYYCDRPFNFKNSIATAYYLIINPIFLLPLFLLGFFLW